MCLVCVCLCALDLCRVCLVFFEEFFCFLVTVSMFMFVFFLYICVCMRLVCRWTCVFGVSV